MRPPTLAGSIAGAVAIVLATPGLAGYLVPGHWEELGEDGAIFVPASPPRASYLPPPDLGPYHNASETVAALLALAASRPDLVAVDTVGTSVQGRPILRATITGPGDASARTRILFDGAHHGDEVIASEILVRWLQATVADYDGDAALRAVLDAVVVDVVPQVNPDGIARVPTCNYYADCRKNARGVDLNRNYPDHWGGTGSSGDPGSATYRGPSPASEPETQAIRALMDAHPYALYASLHSGAEMILWPHGWTTNAPVEAPVFQQLGNELTAITGAPNGQVSRILYSVSGDSMDHAYGSAAGWRAIGISPETYEGSGSAYDWWYLFNPPDSGIGAAVARWSAFLRHLATVAPQYAPATIGAPSTLVLGPDAGELAVAVTIPARRPLVAGSLAFEALGAPVSVQSANPVALSPGSGTRNAAFDLLPTGGGLFGSRLWLDVAHAGFRLRDVALDLSQVGLATSVDSAVVGSPDTNGASVLLDPGPFDRVAGTLTIRILPEGTIVDSRPFDVLAGSQVGYRVAFPVATLAWGDHAVEARAVFTAELGSESRPGEAVAQSPFRVERPALALEKRFAPSTRVGDALPVTSIYRNVGNMPASNVVVRELVPPGYALTTRDGPVPIPVDPVARPAPTSIEVGDDGGLVLTWSFGTVAAGGMKVAQYRLVPLVPGTHPLPSEWSYSGTFASATVSYSESAGPPHETRTT